MGKDYTIADNIRSIAESEGHVVHDITIASAKTYKDCYTWLQAMVTQLAGGNPKDLQMTILIVGMANDIHGFKKDQLTPTQVAFFTDFLRL